MSNADGDKPEFEQPQQGNSEDNAADEDLLGGAMGAQPDDDQQSMPGDELEGFSFDEPLEPAPTNGGAETAEPAGDVPDFGLSDEDAVGPMFGDAEEDPTMAFPGEPDGGPTFGEEPEMGAAPAEPDFAMPDEGEPIGVMAEGAEEEGLADFGDEAVPAAKGKKGKKKSKSKGKKSEKEGKPLLERIAEASPYTVMLGVSLVALIVAVICLAIELGRYDYDIKAEQLSQAPSVSLTAAALPEAVREV